MTYASAKFEVDLFNGLGGDAFTKKKDYLPFDIDLYAKIILNVAQYHLHHVAYTTVKFEGATSNG